MLRFSLNIALLTAILIFSGCTTSYMMKGQQGPSFSKYAYQILSLPHEEQTHKNALDLAIQAGFPRPSEAAEVVMKYVDAERKRLKEIADVPFEYIPPSREPSAWILWVQTMIVTEKISTASWSPIETVINLSECNRAKHNVYISYSTYTPSGSASVVPDKQVSTLLEGGGLLSQVLHCLPANIDPRNPPDNQ